MPDVHEQPTSSNSVGPDSEKGSVVGDNGQSNQERNEEGTYHQAQMSFKPSRKHFFSPLDSSYADAVHRDAETVQFTPQEEVILHI